MREWESESESEMEGGRMGGEEYRCVHFVSKSWRQHERNDETAVLLNIQCEALNDAGEKSNYDIAKCRVRHEQRLTALSTPQQKPYDSASLMVTSPLVTWNSRYSEKFKKNNRGLRVSTIRSIIYRVWFGVCYMGASYGERGSRRTLLQNLIGLLCYFTNLLLSFVLELLDCLTLLFHVFAFWSWVSHLR